MRTFVVCTILILCFSVTLFGQKSETYFYGEESFKSPTQMPEDILKVLKKDEQIQRCFGINSQIKFLNKFFEATEINLNNDKFPDFLVKAKDEISDKTSNCLNGNAISFWVFEGEKSRSNLVLYVYTIAINIDKRKSKGFFSITTNRSTGNATLFTTYAFDGTNYIEKSKKWKNLD